MVTTLRAIQELILNGSGQKKQCDDADDSFATDLQQQHHGTHVLLVLDYYSQACVLHALSVTDARDLPKHKACLVGPPEQNLTVFTCISINSLTIQPCLTFGHMSQTNSGEPFAARCASIAPLSEVQQASSFVKIKRRRSVCYIHVTGVNVIRRLASCRCH